MTAPKYSIIIPHYNIPDLLMRCLASIPIREDVQVIVVDDNSPEADSYIDRYPELSRPYLEFIRTTKGGGAGYARNVGLNHAKGEWLLFADSDDFFSDGFIDLAEQKINMAVDIIYFKLTPVMSDDIRMASNRDQWVNRLLDDFLSTGNESMLRCFHWLPTSKIIRRELVVSHGIRFDETRYSNDVVFSVLTGCHARSIMACKESIYFLTEREGSLVSNFGSKPGELVCRTEVMLRANKIMKSFYNDIPLSDQLFFFMKKLYHTDRVNFAYFFKEAKEYGVDRGEILRHIRWRENGYLNKILVYLNGMLILLRRKPMLKI